jgi:hypothetical protein
MLARITLTFKTVVLLWEAAAIGRVSSSTYDNLEFKINEAVKLMFERLPSDAIEQRSSGYLHRRIT